MNAALLTLLRRLVRNGNLTVTFSSGEQVILGDGTGKPASIRIVDAEAEKARRETMAAGDDLLLTQHFRREKLAFQEGSIRLPRQGGRAVERDVPAFGADDQLLAPHRGVAEQSLNRRSERTLRPLVPIVDRGIDQIDAGRDGGAHRALVRRVVRFRTLAGVDPNSDRGDVEALEGSIEPIGEAVRETPLELRRPFRRRALYGGIESGARARAG